MVEGGMQRARQNAAAPPERNVQPVLGAVKKNHKCTGYRSLGTGADDRFPALERAAANRERQPAASDRLKWSPIALFATRDEK